MKIVYLHYHYRSGGVTSVIQRQLKALNDRVDPFLIVGEEPEIEPFCPYAVISSLAYDRDRTDNISPDKIAEAILKTVEGHFRIEADIYHIHNPTLGKNKDIIDVINYLKYHGQNVLLQIHDFAEDGRVENYQAKPYPSNVHYAVLNSRDYKILIKAGLKSEGLHLLPNSVEITDSTIVHPLDFNNTLILYPVRAIRRKNIGEAVLISLFTENSDYIGITLEPTSKLDTIWYNEWMKFVIENNLRVKFKLGVNNSYINLINKSKMMITTSIKEGFGMSYLEPWIFGRMLLGRRLVDICQDFISNGIDLMHLYDSFMIPIELVDVNSIKNRIMSCYVNNLRSFGIEVDQGEIEGEVNRLISGNFIDFGIMDEKNQMEVIKTLLMDNGWKKRIIEINSKLKFFANQDKALFRDIVEKNRNIIKKVYSFEENKKLLLRIYEKVLNFPVEQSINKEVLIKAFNSLEKISLLLCGKSYV